MNRERELISEINLKEKEEKILWKHKSRNHWIKEGDRNTKLFHRAAIQHRQNNRVPRLRQEDGSFVETHQDMESNLTALFKNM